MIINSTTSKEQAHNSKISNILIVLLVILILVSLVSFLSGFFLYKKNKKQEIGKKFEKLKLLLFQREQALREDPRKVNEYDNVLLALTNQLNEDFVSN